MTTPAAANLYLAQHLSAMEGKGTAFYNPLGKPIEELPSIYGFNNGGSRGWYSAVAIAEDGVCLGGHCCSDEAYMPHDLGILAGTRKDRHEQSYSQHYPDGYRMEFVPTSEMDKHEGLHKAIAANQVAATLSAGEK